MPFLFSRPASSPAGSLLPASLKCSPVCRAWDVRAAVMMAWRVSLPGCLFMAKLLMSSRRYRLVGVVSSGGTGSGPYSSIVSVLAICRLVLVLVVPSRRRGSYLWLLASMSCPSCLILFACYHYLVSSCFSFLISSGVSSCLPYLRCVFLVYFSPRSREACDCLICSRARLVSASRCPVSSCVSGGGGSSCAACLTCPDGVLLISSYRFVGRDGERSALMRLRNLFRGIFMNWE